MNLFKTKWCIFFLIVLYGGAMAATSPFPKSPIIDTVTWSNWSYIGSTTGSDLWPNTWADDDNVYTSWGDGGGFGGSDAGLGFAKITGTPPSISGTNLWSRPRPGGKSFGMICIDGVLYAWLNTQQGSPPAKKLMWSSNHGSSWSESSWSFDSGVFGPSSFLNFGKNYAGARDGYVYAYGGKWGNTVGTYLLRVPKAQIKDKAAYEYFAGLSNNNPTWSKNINDRKPAFSDPNTINEFNGGTKTTVIYNAGLKRYILTNSHGGTGGLGVFDAPEPWGPWTTAAYYDRWEGAGTGGEALVYGFVNKWTSTNGQSAWMIFSGYSSDKYHDRLNLIKATFTLKITDDTPPSAPSNLTAQSISQSQIDLTWTPASDAQSGISSYNVFRNGTKAGTAAGTSYSDKGLTEGTAYTYRVSAVNGAGLEGPKSGQANATTLGDKVLPAIASVSASGENTRVTVVFSEPVEQASAQAAGNYAIDNNITVTGAALQADLKTVLLTTSPLAENITYTLTVNNIKDRASIPNAIAANSTKQFTYVQALIISNLTVSSGKVYEWVTPLETGASVYTDRAYSFGVVPAPYAGMTYLKTANDDKTGTGSGFITFDVNQDLTVYIGYAGSNLPSWLLSWSDTGDDLPTTDRTLHVYSKNFAKGTISLGGNEGLAQSMYTVVLDANIVSSPPDTTPVDTTPPVQGELSVQASANEIVVTSSATPTWKATFLKAKGGALWDLRVPANSSTNVIYNESSTGALHGPILHGALQMYMFEGTPGNLINKNGYGNGAFLTKFDIIKETPNLIRIAAWGATTLFTFKHTITIVPSGFRLDGEAQLKRQSYHMCLQNNFHMDNISYDWKMQDANTPQVNFRLSHTSDSPISLPSGINYPFTTLIPYKRNPNVTFTIKALKVPPEMTSSRQIFANAWGHHNVGNGDFGVDMYLFCEIKKSYAVGRTLDYAWTYQMVPTGSNAPYIPGPEDSLTVNRNRNEDSGNNAGAALDIYPNPFNPAVNINVKGNQGHCLAVYDIGGRKVQDLTAHLDQSRIIWDAAGRPAGIYIVQLKAGSKTLVKRILLSK